MSVSFGAQTGLVLVDARPQAGRCYLPLSQTLLGRTVTIKDQFGVAAVSSIQVLTNSPDTFEDGTTSRWITHGYGFMTISATASNVWTVVGGTRQPSFQASTISTFFVNTQSISSFQSAVSQEVVSTLSAGTAYIGTISTANLAAPSPLFSTAQLLDTGTGTYQTVSLSSSFLYINNTAAPTIVIPTQLVSTVAGLGTTNYISTLSLNSTIAGLGTATYVSSPSLTSSLLGLGSIGYVSSLSMTSSIISTVAGLGTASYVSSPSLTSSLVGLGNAGFISSLSLTSSLVGLGNAGFISSATLLSTAAGLTSNISSLIDPVELTSTIVGMGAVGFISTIGLTSTVQGLGTVGFISTATLVSTVFGLRAETSTVAATAFTGSTVSLSAGTIYVSSFKTSVLNASTAIVTWNGSAAPTSYGLAVDTLTLQTTNAGYGAGIASMAFATATAAYPLARIYAVDSASSGPANSQLVFQTVPLNSIGNAYAEAMRIGTTGNVGIGTAAPAALLDVAGTSRAQALSSLTVNASTFTLNTGKLSTLNVVGSLDMSNTPISNIATTSYSAVYFGNPNQGAGGTYTTYVSSGVTMAVHIFKTVGTTVFTPTQNITGAQLLVIAGGGSGGGGYVGGGGGAGGLVYQTNLTITSSSGPYSIVVGGGGVLAVNNTSFTPGVAGSNTTAFGYTGIGGGGGAGDSGSPPGGCGGGGGQMTTTAGGTGSQGFNGGSGSSPYGGGGGGMGSAGSNYNSLTPSQGGAGVSYSITGSNLGYAAGGGGGIESSVLGPSAGGSVSGTVIGGNGANIVSIATSGTPNTGSGGGGNGKYGGALGAVPGAGGSGIVVLAYPTAQFSSAFSYNVGSITGDANSNLSLQVTNILSITGNTQIAGALQTSTSATSMQTLSTLAINDRTTPSTGSLYQISSVLYYNSTVIGGVTAASIQAFTF